jgi:hypothetical protein
MSSINPNNINGSYPIAGQDNDSQGFRDNFTNVKNNLTFAKTELEDLQNNAILKTGLAGTTLDNEMNNAQLKGAQLLKTVETIKDLGIQTSTTVSFADGHYQKVTTGGPLTISAFTDWPTSGLYAKLRLELKITTPSTDTVTLPATVSTGLLLVQGAVGQTITFQQAGSFIFEFTTYDAGATITISDLSRNKDSVVSDFVISGNLTVGGAIQTAGYQYSAATTGFNDTVGAGIARVIYNPAGTLANGTITLPTGNVDARTVRISSTQIITAFQVLPSVGTTLVPSANITLASGTGVEYFYRQVDAKWYKIG